ncbi:glycine cleavage system protein GcvH [Acholeplasma laidlawii]|jgi:glycine cleavage system H protein|uniref:Glycine cleavage system H protein n=2 Tax=Acholeplasma laidlawii TaxID=2148 RepID=A9NF88_ACHLI|nr:glycine cleavage system protein GcvH [Acholeplasma laidlawii]ABX81018.1 glycine cleavage system, H protein [Acholeplasma laidlawii PG-8A]NWH10413.1 glycine cleavage system protein GcvH [Acholeplasma laidlawii]NWH11800.1 glycine cleavage system protein GcvH [Acholeplasma laidlawii]NWH12792.1 glycine cleavage system protein GcvH [Acholeplasma laidlawii]NWH14394.1 glycine cleavage system protein GcvH [Acholeplasma laidlawii]
MNKNDVLYLDTHEWVFIEGNKAKVGISSYAAMHLGDIVFFDLPSVGQSFKKGDVFAAVESVKSASDLYMPLSGKVLAVNTALDQEPQLINEDPFGNFIVEIELSNPEESNSLLNVTDYEATL